MEILVAHGYSFSLQAGRALKCVGETACDIEYLLLLKIVSMSV